jgi:hypothetical protein
VGEGKHAFVENAQPRACPPRRLSTPSTSKPCRAPCWPACRACRGEARSPWPVRPSDLAKRSCSHRQPSGWKVSRSSPPALSTTMTPVDTRTSAIPPRLGRSCATQPSTTSSLTGNGDSKRSCKPTSSALPQRFLRQQIRQGDAFRHMASRHKCKQPAELDDWAERARGAVLVPILAPPRLL